MHRFRIRTANYFRRLLMLPQFSEKRSLHSRFSIGRGTYGEPEVLQWGETATLRVGAYCSFAGEVIILLGGNHRLDWVTTYPFSLFRPSAQHIHGHPATKGDVNIGNDVWVGHHATILSGVTIGDGAVIGACAVVAKDVPPYGIVVGNPARLLRKRFSEDEISILRQIRWWEWTEAEIDATMTVLLSNDIRNLVNYANNRTNSKTAHNKEQPKNPSKD